MATQQNDNNGVKVELYIYDLTNGLASVLSPAILGQQVAGVWHTAVVAFDREYFFGAGGVTSCAPGSTSLGEPHKIEPLGETFVPYQVFVDYVHGLGTTTFTGASYHLLEHNCNHFTEEVAQFLCGAHIPKHILQQPAALPAPLRLALAALLDNLVPASTPAYGSTGVRHARAESPDFVTLNNQIEQARAAGAELEQRRSTLADKLARKQRRTERRRVRRGLPPLSDMAEAVEAAAAAAEAGAGAGAAAGPSVPDDLDARDEREARRRLRDPPIVYRDIDGSAEYERLCGALEGLELSDSERQSLGELQQYLVLGEGSWVLGDDFLAFVGSVLSDAARAAARCPLVRCLCACALRDDVALLLHQDRRAHALLSYAYRIDAHPQPEQAAIATFMCNLFEHMSSSEWLLYISEWEQAGGGPPLSNIRVTTKVCVHCALGEGELREVGTALMYNIATKEVKTVRLGATRPLRDLLPRGAASKVFDEVSVELAMALLELAGRSPGEEHAWRALSALARLAQHSHDVPALVRMLGPDPSAFRGMSARVDEQVDQIASILK